METPLTVSVIIPTYNRRAWLQQTLDSLAQQTLPADCFEVIVIDDGSTDDTAEITKQSYPFSLRYFWQTNQGDAAARNTAVEQSEAELLVFLDDDILIAPDYLRSLVREHIDKPKRIVVGKENLWLEETNPIDNHAVEQVPEKAECLEEIPFAKVCSNNMSLRREAYLSIGMMEGLDFPGSSMWCDVDFAYRAYQRGFTFHRTNRAVCWHRDYVYSSFENHKKRMREVSFRAVTLFQKYPELPPHIPMFHDKIPIQWGQDPIRLVVRKLARKSASSKPILWSMELLLNILERKQNKPRLYYQLQLWIIGGIIFQGYRKGLRLLEKS